MSVSTLIAFLDGPLKEITVRSLGRVIQNQHCDLMVFFAAGRLGHRAALLAPFLIKAMWEKRPNQRPMAVRTLGQIGPPAQCALGPLRELASGASVRLRLQALDSIRKIQGDKQP